jgi:hypothetical protein
MNPDCYRRRLFVFGYSGRIHQRNRLAGGRHRKCCVRTDQPGTDQFVFQADTSQSLLASDDWTLGTGWASCTVACCSRSPKTALPSTRCWAPQAIACCAATRRSRRRFVSAASGRNRYTSPCPHRRSMRHRGLRGDGEARFGLGGNPSC